MLTGLVAFALFGRYGFNPTDEGFVNAAADRVLRGQVPHVDFIWPRPAGSAYLHAPELLLPLPGILTSRAIALAEICAYTILLGVLVLRRPPWRWGLTASLVGVAAIVLNLHTMPLMSWPTIDGILLVAAGSLLLQSALDSGGVGRLMLAFLLLGAAMTLKQSFWPAPVFGLVWLVAASPRRQLLKHSVAAVIGSLVIPGLYVLNLARAAGVDEMLLQFGSVKPIVGIDLLMVVSDAVGTAGLAVLVVASIFVIGPWPSSMAMRATPVLVPAIVVGGVVAGLGLDLGGEWAAVLFWLVVVSVAVRSWRDRRVDWAGLVLVGTGWMVSLSLGVETPSLMGGSLAAYLIFRPLQGLVADPSAPRGMVRVAGLSAAALLIVLTVPAFVHARLTQVYRDRPVAELTASLGTVHPDWAGVRTNPTTAEYFRELVDCVARFPAAWVAVLPDNPVVYPHLSLRNPFPADWVIPLEIAGSQDRFISAAAELDRRGNYLVLVQRVAAHHLPRVDSLGPSHRNPWRDPTFGAAVEAELTGRRIACGDFVAIWSP